MLYPDLALARRLELHEAWSSSEHARTQARLYPETGAVAERFGTGCAVFAGAKSPLNQVYGWGLSGPVSAADLDAIQAFYAARELQPRIRVCPFADPSLLRLLGEHRYVVQDYMNVYARPLDPLVRQPPIAPGWRIRTATPDEARRWFERLGAGGAWADPDGVTFMTIRCTLKPGTRLYLAWLDGQPAGGGALELYEGVAALMAAETLPAFRKRGIHTALLHARLAAAADEGCDLAMVHTRPGAASQRNVLRAGFQLVYTVTTMVPSS